MSNVYTGASGMISFEEQLNTIGNNIANAKTNGYKRDIPSNSVFHESFLLQVSEMGEKRIGSYQNQVTTDDVSVDFQQGIIKPTANHLNIALLNSETDNGELLTFFMEVQQNGQKYLTKDGNLAIDSQGFLTTKDGSFVLNENENPIQLPIDVQPENLIIKGNGDLLLTDGVYLDSIQIRGVKENNFGFLEKVGHQKFQVLSLEKLTAYYGDLNSLIENWPTDENARRIFKHLEVLEQALTLGEVNPFENGIYANVLQQGFEELSNVNISDEMTQLLIAQKGFTASSKGLTTVDKINEKDANSLGV